MGLLQDCAHAGFRGTVLDKYGATDPAEFFAVATECFFETPAPLKRKHPELYEELKSFYLAEQLRSTRPLFDLVLMGVGPDGHTASLFPDCASIQQTDRWVIGVPQVHVEPFVTRVTLTLPALNSCREMLFEVSGPEKRAILTRVLAGENLPANRAHSIGETIWLVDEAALPEDFRER